MGNTMDQKLVKVCVMVDLSSKGEQKREPVACTPCDIYRANGDGERNAGQVNPLHLWADS
uniref:Uncharacterized protein n=1 Tax=Anguilla anguilla TaxID=7936 RepID=A0A0E9QUS8_ANGAN